MKEKLLIIHMDDIGMSYASNEAAKMLYERGIVTSGSIMMPCVWAHNFIKWHNENRQYDLGIHMTHNCEWETARWRPLSSNEAVPMLFDEEGFMKKDVDDLFKTISIGQIHEEMYRQISTAQKWGAKFSHMDSHMWVATSTDSIFEDYLKIAKENNLIPHIPEWSLWNNERKQLIQKYEFPQVNYSLTLDHTESYEAKKEKLFEMLRDLHPGINVLTIHPVIDTPEIKVIIPGWEERYLEYKLFMDSETEAVIKETGINLISWKDIYI